MNSSVPGNGPAKTGPASAPRPLAIPSAPSAPLPVKAKPSVSKNVTWIPAGFVPKEDVEINTRVVYDVTNALPDALELKEGTVVAKGSVFPSSIYPDGVYLNGKKYATDKALKRPVRLDSDDTFSAGTVMGAGSVAVVNQKLAAGVPTTEGIEVIEFHDRKELVKKTPDKGAGPVEDTYEEKIVPAIKAGTMFPKGTVFAADVFVLDAKKMKADVSMLMNLPKGEELAASEKLSGPQFITSNMTMGPMGLKLANAIKMASDMKLAGEMTIGPDGMKWPVTISVPSVANAMKADVQVKQNSWPVTIKAGSVLHAGSVIAAGSKWNGIVEASDSILTANTTVAQDAKLSSGSKIVAASELKQGSVLPKGTILAPKDATVPAGTKIQANMVLPAGVRLAAGTELPKGSKFDDDACLMLSKEIKKGVAAQNDFVVLDDIAKDRLPVSKGNEAQIMDDYAALLRASDKWANYTFQLNRTMRRILGVSRDTELLKRTYDVREGFIGLVEEKVRQAEEKAKAALYKNADEMKSAIVKARIDAMVGIYSDLANRVRIGNNDFEAAMRWMRKPKVALTRLIIGLGLGTAALLTGTAAFGVAALAIGMVSRFVGAEGLWARMHYQFTKKASKGEYAMAAQVFYNNQKGMLSLAQSKDFNFALGKRSDARDAAHNMDVKLIGYAHSIARKKFGKALFALAVALVPPVAMHYWHELPSLITGGNKSGPKILIPKGTEASTALPGAKAAGSGALGANAPAGTATSSTHIPAGTTVPAATQSTPITPAPVAAPSAPAANIPPTSSGAGSVANTVAGTYTVPVKGGIWHISEKIAGKIPGFHTLPAHDQTVVVDAIKDKIAANPSHYGLSKSELIAHAKGGPWLAKGADLKFTDANLKEAMARVPHRISAAFQSHSESVKQAVKAMGKGAKTSAVGMKTVTKVAANLVAPRTRAA